MENQNIRVSIQWEHSLTNLLGHGSTSDPGIALQQWVHFQGVENILDLLSWEEDELKSIPAQQVFTLDDHGQGSYLRTNQTKQINRNMSKSKGWTLQSSLLTLWMDENSSQQSNKKIADNENLLITL